MDTIDCRTVMLMLSNADYKTLFAPRFELPAIATTARRHTPTRTGWLPVDGFPPVRLNLGRTRRSVGIPSGENDEVCWNRGGPRSMTEVNLDGTSVPERPLPNSSCKLRGDRGTTDLCAGNLTFPFRRTSKALEERSSRRQIDA